MTPETLVFALTIVLAFAHILAIMPFSYASYSATQLVGARDDLPAPANVYFGRATRAFDNLKETLPWALGLLIMVQVTGHTSAVTAAGAWLYLGARVVYLPLYLLGVPWWRSLVWIASLVGLGMLLVPLFG